MKKSLSKAGIGILLVAGLAALVLANLGVITFGRPYIYQLSGELQPPHPLVAFDNVNLVPMDSERVLVGQRVLVREGVIEVIGDSDRVSIPENALVVDGSGKYLMPGLVDMHVHIEYENDLLLFVANGVTGVRNMWGNTDKKLLIGMPEQLELQRQIEDGALFGPTIYTSGPVMEGTPAFHPLAEAFETPEKASESVSWQAKQGYDFIKVYDHLSIEVYNSILTAGRENGMPVVGHVPIAVGLDSALAGGQQTIEHLSGYIDPDAAEFIISEDLLEEYAEKTRQAGVWNVPTLSVYPKDKQSPEGFQQLQDQPGMRYVAPGTRMMMPFLYLMASRSHTYAGEDYPERIEELNRQVAGALYAAGAGILLGTDAAQAYHLPGFAVQKELAMLVEAGLSPYEAIKAGTRDAAEVLGNLDEFGTVETGKRADLILLRNNPLEDVNNLQDRSGVMLRGRWLPEEQLEVMLDGLVESYKPNFLERLWPLVLIGLGVFLTWRMYKSTRRGHE